MVERFTDRIVALATSPVALDAGDREAVAAAFEDILAVTYAGWSEPVTRSVVRLYAGREAVLLDGSGTLSIEHAALIHGAAGHALDYDDVHLTSATHPSVAIVPALLAVADSRPALRERLAAAYAVGLSVNIALGRVLGFRHYDLGWHATSTIGPLAGAAALAHLLRLDGTRTRHALALAAAQAGGLQRNFGTQAKPLQAGLAAAAGVRAALLAEAGVDGDADAFGPRGYFDLYGAGGEPADAVEPAIEVRSVSMKLYPCCYATHRLIAAAAEARLEVGENAAAAADLVEVSVPYGGLRPLRVADPATGLEGKFCAAYTIAAALLQDNVGLPDFTDAAVRRPALRALMERVRVTEEALDGPVPVGMDHGAVRLTLHRDGASIARTEVTAFPGSPGRPATSAEFDAKVQDCLAAYGTGTGRVAPTLAGFRNNVRGRLGLVERAA